MADKTAKSGASWPVRIRRSSGSSLKKTERQGSKRDKGVDYLPTFKSRSFKTVHFSILL